MGGVGSNSFKAKRKRKLGWPNLGDLATLMLGVGVGAFCVALVQWDGSWPTLPREIVFTVKYEGLRGSLTWR